MNRLASVILTNGRYGFLQRTLRALRYTELPADWLQDITVIVNGLEDLVPGDLELVSEILKMADRVLVNGTDVGIAAAWNQAWGLVNAIDTFGCLEHPDMVCLLQDDGLLVPEWFDECLGAFDLNPDVVLLSGYNSPHHKTVERRHSLKYRCYIKETLPGVHLVAKPAFWENVFPIEIREHHTGEDWWISRDSSGAPSAIGKHCGVVPGLCEHIGIGKSTWNPNKVMEYADQVNET